MYLNCSFQYVLTYQEERTVSCKKYFIVLLMNYVVYFLGTMEHSKKKKKKKIWENCFLRGCAMIFLGPEQYLILLFPWGEQFDEVVLRGGCKPILFMTLLILSKFPKACLFDLYSCSFFHVVLKEICNAQSTF